MNRLFAATAAALCLATQLAAAPAAAAQASWRTRYVLGPGDILNFALYGHPELARDQLFVQPDGTITYLQAQNLPVAGLTIDEVRTQIEAKLAGFYKTPRVMISPFELRSKKYYIMGKIVDNGAFTMDRPITVLEAVARSRGMETGLFQQNTVELADLERSFLVRRGRRMSVDFQKLFFEGDMTQNVELEPDDYLYFPSSNSSEIFVLGEVTQPGVQGLTNRMTALGAIARRDGFTRAAYRERVLVIRGSLKKPELFVVDTNAILKGKQPDFLLKPKDIVYVNARPWKFAEDLLDMAFNAFTQSAVTTWTGSNIGPFIKDAFIPGARD